MAERSRRAVITVDDHGPILAMTAWLLLCILLLCIGMRLGLRYSTRRLPTTDDAFIIAAGALMIANTVTISLAVDSGLGRRSNLVTDADLEVIQVELYVSTILYVFTIGVSKISITTFFARLACTPYHKTAVLLLRVVIAAWTVAIAAGAAFECVLPRPWEIFTGKCIPLFPFWLTAGILDVLTDIAMVALPIHIVMGVQLESKKKAIVTFMFSIRIVLIAASIIRIIFLQKLLTGNRTLDSIPYGIATQCHATLSVMVACSPALRLLMVDVQSGMLSARLANHSPGNPFRSEDYNLQTFSKPNTPMSPATKSTHMGNVIRPPSSTATAKAIFHPIKPANGMQFVYIRNDQGRIVPVPASRIGSSPSPSLSSITRSPARPPPPPEELRPDLSMFTARIAPRTPESQSESVRTAGGSRWSGESDNGRVRIIPRTRR